MGLPSRKPWEQQDDEPNAAYNCFRAYLDQKPNERNALQVYRQIYNKPSAKQPGGAVGKWTVRFDWRGRARAYDQMIAAEEIEAARQAAYRRAKLWEDRRQQIADSEWEMADALQKKLAAMLALPVTEKVIEETKVVEMEIDGEKVKVQRVVTVIKPVRWNGNTVQHYMEQVSKLRRRAAEMTLDKIEVAKDTARSEPDNMLELAKAALVKAREEFTDLDDDSLLSMVASSYSVTVEELRSE